MKKSPFKTAFAVAAGALLMAGCSQTKIIVTDYRKQTVVTLNDHQGSFSVSLPDSTVSYSTVVGKTTADFKNAVLIKKPGIGRAQGPETRTRFSKIKDSADLAKIDLLRSKLQKAVTVAGLKN